MSFIYYYYFQLQAELLVVFNIIKLYFMKMTLFIVLGVCLLIWLYLSLFFQVSTTFQLRLSFLSPLRGRWWKDSSWTQTSHKIHEVRYTPVFPEGLDYSPIRVLPSYLTFIRRLIICACSIVQRASHPPSPIIIGMWTSYGYHTYL